MQDDASLLRQIAAAPRISGVLRELVDFDVEDLESVDGSTARLSSGIGLRVIACDGAGGRFFLVGPDGVRRPVLYADSEGSAGLVGPSLSNALATMVALPNWRDLLTFSGGGDLGQMRRAQAWLEEGMGHWHSDLDELQAALVTELDLIVPDDPVMALWEAAHAAEPDLVFIDDHDEDVPWGPLFGQWTIERLMKR